MRRAIAMLPVILGAAAVLSFAALLASDPEADYASLPNDGDAAAPVIFNYYDIAAVSDVLAERGLELSTPVPITDHTIPQYCAYYDDDAGEITSVSYCTTSGITDSNGITIGNVNLGGDTESPVVAIAVLDPVPPVDSGRAEHAAAVLAGVIEGLVCDCWHDVTPGGFESISDWMGESERMLEQGDGEQRRTSLRSEVSGLADGVLVSLECTAVSGGYQWTMIITQGI